MGFAPSGVNQLPRNRVTSNSSNFGIRGTGLDIVCTGVCAEDLRRVAWRVQANACELNPSFAAEPTTSPPAVTVRNT